MRLAVLSDIHGNRLALEAVLGDLKQCGGADKTWVLGDLCAFGPHPVECLHLIRDLPQTEVIRGNTDRYLVTGERPTLRPQDEADWQTIPDRLRERDANFNWTVSRLAFADYEYLSKLHRELSLDVPDYGRVIGYHGAPGDDERNLLPDTPADEVLDQMLDREGRLGFGGHTHIAMDRDLGHWRVVNVGSVGLPRDAAQACYALATFEAGSATVALRRVEFDMAAVEKDMQQQDHPGLSWWRSVLKASTA
jgi:predicted phosphodiesterase